MILGGELVICNRVSMIFVHFLEVADLPRQVRGLIHLIIWVPPEGDEYVEDAQNVWVVTFLAVRLPREVLQQLQLPPQRGLARDIAGTEHSAPRDTPVTARSDGTQLRAQSPRATTLGYGGGVRN